MPYTNLIASAAQKYGLDPDLLTRMVSTESGGNPTALSPKGAQGLMQLMPATAQEMGVQDPLDPSQNIEGGAGYLSKLLKQFGGDVNQALAAYNFGPGNVSKGLHLPKETQDYVTKVTGKNPQVNTKGAVATSIEDLFEEDSEKSEAGVATSVDNLFDSTLPVPLTKTSTILDQVGTVAKETVDYWKKPVVNAVNRFGNEAISALQPPVESSTKPLSSQAFKEGAQTFADVGLGAIEAPVALAGAGASFGAGVLASLPVAGEAGMALLDGNLEGFWNKLSEGKKILDNVLQNTMWHPTTKTGNVPLAMIGKVFQEGHNFIEASIKGGNKFKELPWRPDEEMKIVEGSQYLFDVAALGIGGVHSKGNRPLTMRDFRDTNIINALEVKNKGDVVKAVDKGRKVIKKIVPDAPKEAVDVALQAMDNALKNRLVKESSAAKVEGNQSIVEGLKREALERTGGKRAAYNRVAKFVEELTVDVSEIDLATGPGMKDAKSKTRAAVKRLLMEREAAKAAEVVSASIPKVEVEKSDAQVSAVEPSVIEQPVEVAPTESTAPVQPTVPQLPPELAKIVPVFDSTTLAKGEGYELPSLKRYKTEGEAAKAVGEGQEVIQIGEKFAVAKWSDAEPEIPRYNSIAELKEEFEVGSEVSRDRALKDIEELAENGPEFGVAEVDGKYYRTVKKYEVEKGEVKSVEDIIEDPVKTIERDLNTEMGLDVEDIEPTPEALHAEEMALKEELKVGVVEAKALGGEVRPELIEAFQRYRDRSVTKINKANNKSPKKGKKVEKAEELSVVSDDFKSFKSREEAEAYRDAVDPGRGVLGPDPNTGKYYLEPKLEGMDDFTFERDLQDIESGIRRDRFEGDVDADFELSDTGISDLWNILGNERGAVEIPFDIQTLRNLKVKLERIEDQAKKLNLPVSTFLKDFLNMEGVSLQNTLDLMKARGEIDQKLRSLDKVTEDIFYPESKITRQKVRTTKKGVVVKEIPQTLEMEKLLREAPKDVAWKPSFRRTPEGLREAVKKLPELQEWIGGYQQWTELPLAAFERYGLEEVWWKWAGKEKARREWILQERDAVKGLRDTFSKKEIEDMSVVAYSRMKGGTELLESMGVDVPQITPRQETGLEWFTPRHDRIIDLVNYNRTHTGLNPYGKVDNYFTWQRQVNEMIKAGLYESPVNVSQGRLAQLSKEFRSEFNPYGQKRVRKSQVPIELDVFTGYLRYIESMSREMYTMPVAALAKKMAHAKVPKIESGPGGMPFSKTNPEASWVLNTWSDNLMGVNVLSEFNKKFPAFQKVSNYLHRNIVASTLLGSVNTAFKQVSAFTGTVGLVGFTPTIWGIARAATEKPVARWRGERTRAKKVSDVLTIRRSDYYFDQFHEFYIKGDIGALKHRAGEVAGLPMNIFDSFTAEASWNAFYDYSTKIKKLSHEDAKRWADRGVVYTQSVGVKGAIAPIQTVPGLNLFVIFQSFAITDYNHIARNLLGIKNPDVKANPAQFRHVARYIAAAYMMNQVFHMMGTDPPHPAPIKESQEWMKEGGSATTAGIKGMLSLSEKLPVVGGPMKYGTSLLGPSGELSKKLPDAFHQAVEMTDWANLSEAQRFSNALNIGEVIGTVTGIPMTRQIRKSIRAASQTDDPFKVIVGIYDYELKKKKGGNLIDSPLSDITSGPLSAPF